MRNTIHILFLLSLGFLTLVAISCEDDGPEIMGIEPYFNMKLINQDSIVQLKNSINEINTGIRAIEARLDEIEELEEGGDDTDYIEEIDSLSLEKDTLNIRKSTFNEVINDINSGRMQITRLSAAGGDIIYEDSLSTYRFPLNTNADSSRFFVTIGELTYTIKASYERDTWVRERTIFIDAFNFNIDDHTFDSLKIRQSDSINFSSDEATVTVYF